MNKGIKKSPSTSPVKLTEESSGSKYSLKVRRATDNMIDKIGNDIIRRTSVLDSHMQL